MYSLLYLPGSDISASTVPLNRCRHMDFVGCPTTNTQINYSQLFLNVIVNVTKKTPCSFDQLTNETERKKKRMKNYTNSETGFVERPSRPSAN